MFDRYNLGGVKNAIEDPSRIRREGERVAAKISLSLQEARFRRRYGSGCDIMQLDWDNLIILDACRYDTFSEVNWIEGELDSVISAGSHSIEFAKSNFKDKELFDTVYVTANAHAARIAEGSFHSLIFTERTGGENSWATRHGMHPEMVRDAALAAMKEHPDKRHIVHFMQPHNPYFGERAEEIRHRLSGEGIDDLGASYWNTGPDLCLALREGFITLSEFKKVYKENLEFVLQYAEDLCESFKGNRDYIRPRRFTRRAKRALEI